MKRSFTLLELLITIAVIALLAGILLPVLNRAREEGKRTSCISNLRQIGTGLELYAPSHGFRLPVCSGSYDPAAGPSIKSTLLAFVSGGDGVWRCPGDPREPAAEDGSYDWNTLANGLPMDEKTMQVQGFTMPVMSDYDNFHRASGEVDARNWLYLPAEVQKLVKK